MQPDRAGALPLRRERDKELIDVRHQVEGGECLGGRKERRGEAQVVEPGLEQRLPEKGARAALPVRELRHEGRVEVAGVGIVQRPVAGVVLGDAQERRGRQADPRPAAKHLPAIGKGQQAGGVVFQGDRDDEFGGAAARLQGAEGLHAVRQVIGETAGQLLVALRKLDDDAACARGALHAPEFLVRRGQQPAVRAATVSMGLFEHDRPGEHAGGGRRVFLGQHQLRAAQVGGQRQRALFGRADRLQQEQPGRRRVAIALVRQLALRGRPLLVAPGERRAQKFDVRAGGGALDQLVAGAHVGAHLLAAGFHTALGQPPGDDPGGDEGDDA